MTVPLEQQEALDKAFEQFAKQVPAPDFLPGPVQTSFHELRYGIFREAFNAGVVWARGCLEAEDYRTQHE